MHLVPAPNIWDLFRYFWHQLTAPKQPEPPPIARFLENSTALRRLPCPKCSRFEVINTDLKSCFECFREGR